MPSSNSSSPHKPRRKSRKTDNGTDASNRLRTETLIRAPSFPLASFLWSARGHSSLWEVLPVIIMLLGLFRWAAGLWGYSGHQQPPMFGDYEAQRHWMEVTTQLPISEWYFHDLQWWGLDYPPLTAYHSWLMGSIGALIDSNWFALFTSRGSEDPSLKIFMRATVLVSEYVTFLPTCVLFVRRFGRISGVASWASLVALTAILMQPALILIDHVHFQYNSVMLGLVLASMTSMLAERYSWAALFFVAALGYKQMALYYAPSVFAYLAGRCLTPTFNFPRLLSIAAVTVASFLVLVLPILLGTLYDRYRGIDSSLDRLESASQLPLITFLVERIGQQSNNFALLEQLVQIIHRIFPFSRGLFEDKVANFWCAANVIIKLRQWPQALLQKWALAATLMTIIPPNTIVLLQPRKSTLPLAFATTAWAFFLFSYQVHEKSVLLPLMPMTLLFVRKHGMDGQVRAWIGFANLLGAWTMYPLLSRVDLRVPYAVLTLLWAYLLDLPPFSWTTAIKTQHERASLAQWATTLLHGSFYVLMALWHILHAFIIPPLNKPDLWVVLNVGIGAVGFMLCYLWCLWMLFTESYVYPKTSVLSYRSKTKIQ